MLTAVAISLCVFGAVVNTALFFSPIFKENRRMNASFAVLCWTLAGLNLYLL